MKKVEILTLSKTELKSLCARAAAGTEQWMLNHLEDLYKNDVPDDPVTYYKWPLALYERGRIEEAKKLLEWIKDQCLTSSGDFLSERRGFHREFYNYANLWLILAAIKLREEPLAKQALEFITRQYNPDTGGLLTKPEAPGILTEDPLSTSFLGMAACELEDERLAGSVFEYLRRWVDQPLDEGCLWLRTSREGTLIRHIPEGEDPSTWAIELGKKDESYYFLGSICYFLARYIETFSNPAGRELAEQVAGILESIGEEALTTIWAAKVAPGCTALYGVTGERIFLDFARPVIGAVLAGQTPEGYWLKNGKPWITVSAEQCYWLSGISKRL